MLSEIEILETTYFDLCTIKRKEKVKDPGTGITTTAEVIKAKDVKCALSKGNRTNSMLIDGVGTIIESYTMFINPNTNLQVGDTVMINSLNGEHLFIANKPFVRPSHMECNLIFKERV